jgi:energy-coupling factor transporter ATP-binding protein EcfA2
MAGTTGSGKSECLQAIILSLIVNFHPDDVCFVLIDFKGGGMANLFGDVPHIAGTITNLGNQIKRSMASLNAEMTRRQAMLKDAGVNHIDKYQTLYKEGKTAVPMPHMVLVSDEFAELKQQQPEFMAQLISVARIGRSLGVHLILATQKPTGVVDDQIWSNTRFRICLKVADKADSSGMIGSPLAAAVTLPGRGYVQVGYNEIFEHVQTAYTGADYIPLDGYVDLDTRQVSQIDSCGQVVASASAAPKRKAGTGGAKKQSQLEAVVEYVENLAREKGVVRRPIWADPLPRVLPLDDVKRAAVPDPTDDGTKREALVGLIDDPAAQTTLPLSVSLDRGHVAIYGMPGCGKTTFTQTMLYYLVTTYKPAQFRLEIIDFGGRTLEIFAGAPHTGRVLNPSDADGMTELLRDLLDEIEARKEKFAASRQETLRKYVKSTGDALPVILLVVDGYGKFREEAPDQSDMLTEALKEGAKYGVIVMLCADTVSAISYKFGDYITEKITLQLGDPIDYASVVGSVMGMFPEPVKGRGLVRHDGRVTEFQSAVVYGETDDGARSGKIAEELRRMERPKGRSKPAAASGIIGVPGISGANNSEKKERPAGGLGGIPGFGSGRTSASAFAAKKGGKRLPVTQFMPEDRQGVRVASGRVSGTDYLLPHGQGMYFLHTGSLDRAILRAAAEDAAAKGRRVWHCAPNRTPDGAPPAGAAAADTEAEMTAMTESLRGGGACVVAEDLMEFYKVISDDALNKLVALLSAESSDISFIAGVKREDAQILKDYPLGMLLFRTWNRGILAEGKPIDSAAVLPGELLTRMAMDERGMAASGKTALLFQGDGAFEKVVLHAAD